jgi:quercetin dioxygenase-like cupin family protein
MSQPTFETWKHNAQAEGFDEIVARSWAASTVVETHAHPFAVKALVTEGEMWLIVGDSERHLVAGDEFTLQRDEPHAERYGPQGATYWAARRYAAR